MSTFQGHRYIEHPDGSTDDSWRNFTCASCNKEVSGAIVAYFHFGYDNVYWLQCPNCADGAVVNGG